MTFSRKFFLHNTISGKKEEFQPLVPGHVGLYVCGITPYDESHLGHARCYVVFDVLKRVLRYQGYQVKHVQNFTDIDDKIIDRANKEKRVPSEFAQQYIDSFIEKMAQLNVDPADSYPRVTTSIPLIIDLVDKLIRRGFAYSRDGDVFYRVRRFESYGQLSKRKIDELAIGARVSVDENKEDPLDFALWKKAKEGEPNWASPWGPGRPGWHIECSAMSMNELGPDFDIHGGGQDLIFPHHENELAQSVGATGAHFARVWVHNGFVTINEEKMSKSLGNFFTLKDILARFDPMTVRYFLLSQHYRSPLNFSDKELHRVQTTWQDRIVGATRLLTEARPGSVINAGFSDLADQFIAALADDLNTPAALGYLNQYCSQVFKLQNQGVSPDVLSTLKSMMDMLGLRVSFSSPIDPELELLLAQRFEARNNKDWARADQIRNRFKEKGWIVEDTPQGPRLKKAST